MPLPKYKETDFPEPGSVFVAPMKDGRLNAGRVLRRERQQSQMTVLIAGTPWIGSVPPPLDLPLLRDTLRKTHHAWGEPDSFGEKFNRLWAFQLMPADFTIIGSIDLTREDRSIKCNSYGGWESLPQQAWMQWRWDHDRESLLREERESAGHEAVGSRISSERRAELLRSLTLESLAGRNWFATWDESRGTTLATRKLLTKLVEELRALPKLSSGPVGKLLQSCIKELNRLDRQSQFIDTVEREQLYEAFEQILWAARQPSVIKEIERWREW